MEIIKIMFLFDIMVVWMQCESELEIPQTRFIIGKCYDLPECIHYAVAKLEIELALDLN